VDVEAYDLNVQGSVSGIDTGGVQNPLTADLDAGGNSLFNAASVSVNKEIIHGDNPQATIYVRSSGSDSNAGFSPTNAVATIKEALNTVPKIRVGASEDGASGTVIDLEAGANYDISTGPGAGLVYQLPEQPLVSFNGDSTNPPTIRNDGESFAMQFQNTSVRFNDVNFSRLSGTGGGVRVEHGDIRFDNCEFTGALGFACAAYFNSYLRFDSNSVVDGDGSGGDTFGIAGHSSSQLDVRGTVRNCKTGVYWDRDATGIINTGTIEDNNRGIRIEDRGSAKLVDSTLQNNNTGIYAVSDAQFRVESGNTITGNTTTYDIDKRGVIQKQDGSWLIGASSQTTDSTALLQKSTNQSIAQNSNATVEWDTQEFNSDIFSWDGAAYEINVEVPGDYTLSSTLKYANISSGDFVFIRAYINGVLDINLSFTANNVTGFAQVSKTLRGLSAGDRIRIEARTDSSSGGSVGGDPDATFATVSYEG
jgi:hypothetical protein